MKNLDLEKYLVDWSKDQTDFKEYWENRYQEGDVGETLDSLVNEALRLRKTVDFILKYLQENK